MKFGTWEKYNINSHIVKNVTKNPNRLDYQQYCKSRRKKTAKKKKIKKKINILNLPTEKQF